MLYWAEGAKSGNQVCFPDPEMVKPVVVFLRRYFGLRDSDLRVSCHLFADHLEREREVERLWLDVTGLPETSLRKSGRQSLFAKQPA